MKRRWLFAFFLIGAVFLQGCASVRHKIYEIGTISSYDSVLRDYRAGRILEARNRVLHMDHQRSDYQRSRQLLIRKIEPARRRLAAYYTRKAKSAERRKQWVEAERFYLQAVQFTLGDVAIKKKSEKISLIIRQIRLDRLFKQRRKEDKAFMRWLGAYEVPSGLDPRDEPFIRMLRERQRRIDARANLALTEADRYLGKGYPEVAYVEIESYLFFRPKSRMGRGLKAKIRKSLPKGIKIPSPVKIAHGSLANHTVKTTQHAVKTTQTKKPPLQVKASDIENLIRSEDLIKAYKYAKIYYDNEGANADRYLIRIEQSRKDVARAYFHKGKLAFQRENLDRAVRLWSRSAELDPDKEEYTESLQRAEQLRERLQVLRQNNRR